jgi:hypothetical protein
MVPAVQGKGCKGKSQKKNQKEPACFGWPEQGGSFG